MGGTVARAAFTPKVRPQRLGCAVWCVCLVCGVLWYCVWCGLCVCVCVCYAEPPPAAFHCLSTEFRCLPHRRAVRPHFKLGGDVRISRRVQIVALLQDDLAAPQVDHFVTDLAAGRPATPGQDTRGPA